MRTFLRQRLTSADPAEPLGERLGPSGKAGGGCDEPRTWCGGRDEPRPWRAKRLRIPSALLRSLQSRSAVDPEGGVPLSDTSRVRAAREPALRYHDQRER
jgi:hypothetical protein